MLTLLATRKLTCRPRLHTFQEEKSKKKLPAILFETPLLLPSGGMPQKKVLFHEHPFDFSCYDDIFAYEHVRCGKAGELAHKT